ncbi:MAG: serine protease [Acidobacteria bacterium]|nr:serine protease [Acidobacteriota bacterium]
MPIWSEILRELAQTAGENGPPDFDRVRRRYLAALQAHTRRNVVLYASGWLQKDVPPALTSINEEDIHALMEVTSGLQGTDLDLILHSPGGSPEAAEGIVSYLRSRFDHIRVIVPQLAMSAATMISCAADEILMGKHSFLGPIDPQLLVSTQLGPRAVPAQAVLDQFDKAQQECADPAKLSAWLPMLGQYGPDVLIQCEMALSLSRELVSTWLETYMYRGLADANERAGRIADWLSDHTHFKSHSRHLPRSVLREHGLVVSSLEDDDALQDLSLSVFHATTHTFAATSAAKIVENHTGRAFIKQHRVPQPAQTLQVGFGPGAGQPNERPGMPPETPTG